MQRIPLTATRWASGIGQGIGWAFIVVGIAMAFGVRVPVFGTGLVGGLWLAFIGWFLRTAASQAGVKVAIGDALAGHTVEDLMTRTAPTVSPELPVATLVHDYFVRADERAVPVVRDDRLVGVVSISNVRVRRQDVARWLELVWRPSARGSGQSMSGPIPRPRHV